MDEKRWADERESVYLMVDELVKLPVARSKAGRRKLRLFACGCCWLIWQHLLDEELKWALGVAEKVADGEATEYALFQPRSAAWERGRYDDLAATANHEQIAARAVNAACYVPAYHAATHTHLHTKREARERRKDNRHLCDLLRCVFGNPFRRRRAFLKKWRTETVTALAAGIYEERAFDRLPILADALEEAGCDDPTMLAHLRGDGPHCRGCWVLDLALGK
jgi:hypothetical protein